MASRRSSSASMASLMNAAMRLGPTSASMRCRCSSVRRTFVSLTLSGGRPIRAGVSVPEKFVKVIEKASPLIDIISVPGYITGDGYEINGRTQMAKIIDTRKTPLPLNDAARPFAVIFGGRVVGRYETQTKAKRRLRGLTPCVTVQPLERNPFYDNVQWVRS